MRPTSYNSWHLKFSVVCLSQCVESGSLNPLETSWPGQYSEFSFTFNSQISNIPSQLVSSWLVDTCEILKVFCKIMFYYSALKGSFNTGIEQQGKTPHHFAFSVCVVECLRRFPIQQKRKSLCSTQLEVSIASKDNIHYRLKLLPTFLLLPIQLTSWWWVYVHFWSLL